MISLKSIATYSDFQKVQRKNPRYWNDNRWQYSSIVLDMIKKMPQTIQTSLEIGSYDFKLIRTSVVMDRSNKSDIKHDATISPYPFLAKEFDLVIALQVWEHLGRDGGQQKAFKELQRISKGAVLSFPYLCKMKDINNCHHMVDKKTIAQWTCNIKPVEIVEVKANNGYRRLVYQWRFK
jgi:hypothetical protein